MRADQWRAKLHITLSETPADRSLRDAELLAHLCERLAGQVQHLRSSRLLFGQTRLPQLSSRRPQVTRRRLAMHIERCSDLAYRSTSFVAGDHVHSHLRGDRVLNLLNRGDHTSSWVSNLGVGARIAIQFDPVICPRNQRFQGTGRVSNVV